MTATFCGHSKFPLDQNQQNRLTGIIEKTILSGVNIFLCGAYGDFDNICAEILLSLKQKYPQLKIIAVTPYITEAYQTQNKYLEKNYDEVIYPPIEKTPYRLAIIKRNEWMVDNSDIIISGVVFSFGGAARILSYAKRKKKEIISII